MYRKLATISIVILIALLAGAGMGRAQEGDPGVLAPTSPLGTAFTYQGRLSQGGSPASGGFDFEFYLFDALSGGTQVGGPIVFNDLNISDGYFTVPLDFGASAFAGQSRYLEARVRLGSDTGGFTILAPRQELTAAPYASYARAAPWSGLSGVPSGFADNTDNDTTYTAGTGLTLSGTTFSADTAYMQRRVSGACGAGYAIRTVNSDGTVTCEAVAGGAGDITAVNAGTGLSGGGASGDVTLSLAGTFRLLQSCANGQIARWDTGTSTWTCSTDSDTTSFWSLTGNSGTDPAINYLGTSNNTALELRVNNLRVLRLEPDPGGPNVIGGYDGNWITSGVHGATLFGGGMYSSPNPQPNRVTDYFGTVSGGMGNQAGDDSGSLDGAMWATVGGGGLNQAIDDYATIGGGHGNEAGYEATVGGGDSNLASGCSTVGGGRGNQASGAFTTVGGGYYNQASDDYATIGGGSGNQASNDYATVGGGYSNVASGLVASVSGGDDNQASGKYATVGGGSVNKADGDYSFVAGRRAVVTSGGYGSFVFSDSKDFDTKSTVPNQFVARATGGVFFGTGIDANGNFSAGVGLSSGSSQWYQISDRNMKMAFQPIDAREIAAKVAGLPLSTWSYKAQSENIRHMGPMAQDFYAAFGLGEDERYIGTLDINGVALAAIQGLYQENQELQAENAALKQQNADFEQRLQKLEALAGIHQPSHAALPVPAWLAIVAGWVLGGFGAIIFWRRKTGQL